jgi:hypothetical protein
MLVKNQQSQNRISLLGGAQRAGLTPQGLLKILRRTGKAIRDDGHWYADPAIVDRITAARQALGLARTKREKRTAAR